jgi:hypothetical protein
LTGIVQPSPQKSDDHPDHQDRSARPGRNGLVTRTGKNFCTPRQKFPGDQDGWDFLSGTAEKEEQLS